MADADRYFGREELAELVFTRLEDVRERLPSASALVPVIGPSGAGKSSLLHAGLLPLIRARRTSAATLALTPGADLELTWRRIRASDADDRPAYVVLDQFEELFTQVRDQGARELFLRRLADVDPRRMIVVLGLRADFYQSAMAHPQLGEALQHNQVLVTPMSDPQLRRAIVAPAERVGLTVDEDLVDAVLADLTPLHSSGRAHDPGALPLMSHALLSTWSRSSGGVLTLADYRAAGGIAGAVQQTAEEAFRELEPADRELTRRMFVRMIAMDDDDTTAVRRRIDREELDEFGPADAIDAVIDTFVSRRLLTAGTGTLQISHEALLTAWPRLAEWIAANRDGIRLRRRLTEDATAWADADRDDALLLTGGRLSTAVEWTQDPDHAELLNGAEKEFVAESALRRDAAREAEKRQNRRLKQLLSAVAALAVVASVLVVIAVRAVRDAQSARDNALSRGVAGSAEQVTNTSPNLAAQLAIAALRIADTAQARSAVIDATAATLPSSARTDDRKPLRALVASDANHAIVAAGDDGEIHCWTLDGDNPVPTSEIVSHPHPDDVFANTDPADDPTPIEALALEPGGAVVWAGDAAGDLSAWALPGPSRTPLWSTHGPDGAVLSLAVSRDGRLVVAGTDMGLVQRYRVGPQGALEPLGDPISVGDPVQAIAIDPTAAHIALAAGHTVRVMAADGSSGTAEDMTRTLGSFAYAVAFAPDGSQLAAGGNDHQVQVWNLEGGEWQPGATLRGPTQRVNVVAFRHDGAQLVIGSADESVRVYDPHGGTLLRTLPQPQAVTDALYLDGRIVTTSGDGTVRVWPRTDPTLRGVAGDVHQLSEAGTLLAAGIAPLGDSPEGLASPDDENGALQLWSLDSPRPPAKLYGDPKDPFTGAVGLSPDASMLAAGTVRGAVRLFGVDDPQSGPELRELGAAADPLHEPERVEQIAFSSAGDLLAASGDAGTVALWRVASGSARLVDVLADARAYGYTYSPTFNHDGTLLAAGSDDGKVFVWRLHGDDPPTLVGSPLGGFTGAVKAVRFAPHTDVLAAADTRVLLFDFSAGAPTGPMALANELNSSRSAVYALDFSTDGALVAAATRDAAVYLYGTGTGDQFAALRASGLPLSSVVFDGSSLLAGAVDGTVHRWTTDLPQAQASLCRRAGTPISDTVWDQYVPGKPYDQPCP